MSLKLLHSTSLRRRVLYPVPLQQLRNHHPSPFDPQTTKGWKAAVKETNIPTSKHDAEVKRGLEIGLQGASSINDKTIPTFSRGELPHFAGINTFMKAPYVEDVREVGGKVHHLTVFHRVQYLYRPLRRHVFPQPFYSFQ